MHFSLCLLNFRWFTKTANKRTNWCQLQGLSQRNWNESTCSFHTHDSSALNLIVMISHLDTIIDKNTIPDLSYTIPKVKSRYLITGTDTTDFPEFGFNFLFFFFSNSTISVETLIQFHKEPVSSFKILLKCCSWKSLFLDDAKIT